MKTLLIFAILAFFIPASAYAAVEIIAIPESDPFGPDDPIKIDIELDGYSGGNLEWTATKPDGTTESGEITSFKAKKAELRISRNAFDNQFGTWSIKLVLGDVEKIIDVEVEPLEFDVSIDKQTYQDGDIGHATITTNYFVTNAAKAEEYEIEIHTSDGVLADHSEQVSMKAYRQTTPFEFDVSELFDYNPLGEYKLVVKYYNKVVETPFSIGDTALQTSLFIGTDRTIYQPGETVELQIIASEILGSDATIRVTDPSGMITSQTVPIVESLTRVYLTNIPLEIGGQYTLAVDYGGKTTSDQFSVESDVIAPQNSNIILTLNFDKQFYQPGEAIIATASTDTIADSQINYWLEDPTGVKSAELTLAMPSGSMQIPYVLDKTSEQGPWKFFIDYGGAEIYSIFFVEGEPIEQTTVITSQAYEGPEILTTISSSSSSLINPKGIDADSEGFLYVVDSGSSDVKKFDSDGRLVIAWGEFGSEEGQFKTPSGIYVDTKQVHVADTGNSRIQTFDKDGNFIREWGNLGIDSISVLNPVSIVKDNDGIFYVADSSLNKISKYDEAGEYVGQIDSILTAAAKFSSSNDIASSTDGIFFLISNDNRIMNYHGNGNFIKSFGTTGNDEGRFNDPAAFVISNDGKFYVADGGNYRVQILDSAGKYVDHWGSLGTGEGQFMKMESITLDNQGNVWVSDSGNKNIQKFSLGGNYLTIPDWIKNNAEWWSDKQIADDDFANGIQFMIENEIIVIPELEESGEKSEQQIPDWVRNNAAWWAAGQISDEDFANGIEFLVKNGIIQV